MRLFALLAFALALFAVPAQPAAARTGVPTIELPFRAASCAGAAPRPGRLAVEVTRTAALAPFAPGWNLLVDRVRYSDIRINVRTADGVTTLRNPANALGGFDAFAVPVAGREVTAICISLASDDSPSLLRSVKAATPGQVAERREGWIAIAVLVCGVLACSLAYNLFLFFWLKDRFQRWYVLWLISGIAYTLLWSGVASLLLPGVAPVTLIRFSIVAISLLIGFGSAFFFDFVEPHAVPRWLRRFGRANALLLPLFGLAAAADPYIPAGISDRLLNLAFLAATLGLALGVGWGLARRSRAVWFYLAGWTPPVSVFALRVARNFGALSQSDAIDKASFIAIAFEAVVLSLAIADRFRSLLRERDIAEAERETLRRVASTDTMTGLLNRAAFQLQLTTLQSQGIAADLVLLDLDDLKQTNDLAGHDAGDALLVEIARRLVTASSGKGFVARLGGDEFAVLLTEHTRDVLDPLLALVEQSPATPFSYGERGLSASLSAGLASWLPSDRDGGDLYKKADLALYRAKAAGRGCWRAFEPAMLDEQEARHASVQSLRNALAQGELGLHHQPIVDLRSGETLYDEALLRWSHPDHGLLGPDIFANAWEDPATAAAVQDFVINLALDQLRNARAKGAPLHTLSVNFLAGQLQGREAAAHILGLVAERGLAPSALIVEVTETVVLGRPGGAVIECLQALRQGGVRVALDDFGTGYASLVHLRDLSADILKIDRSFVSNVPADVESAKIVRAMVALAHSLGLHVVAEGVETEAQRDFLRALGCDSAQGFLLGRPAPFA